jgi:hypothetical protein
MDKTDTKQELMQYIDSLGLTYQATFQPTPQTGVEYPQLHWLITLEKGKQRMQVPYHQGIGHVQGYQQHSFGRKTLEWQEQENRYRKTCETGKIYKHVPSTSWDYPVGDQPAPTLADVLYCLISDADVLNYASYEEWASEFGYDEDSRKGEQTYRLCLEQSLRLKRLLFESQIDTLRTLFQDY